MSDHVAPTAARLRILHLSDTHLFGDDTLHHGSVDTLAALRRVLDHAARIPSIDVVVLSGDLSDDGTDFSYATLRDLVEPWAAARGASVVYAAGNHDIGGGYETVFGPRSASRTVTGVGGDRAAGDGAPGDGYPGDGYPGDGSPGVWRFVTVDTSVPGAGYGSLSPVEIAEFSDRLAAPTSTPLHGLVAVMHHPPVPAVTPLLHALELVDPVPFVEACATAGVRVVLAGHYHHALVSSVAGIPVVVAPGIANAADPFAPDGAEEAFATPGYVVVDVPVDPELPVRAVPVVVPPEGLAPVFSYDGAAVARIASEAGPPVTTD